MNKIKRINNMVARRVQKYSDIWAQGYWHDNPFGDQLRADEATYFKLWEDEKQAIYPGIDKYEETAGFSIDKTWLDDLALHTQIVIKGSPLCYQHGRVVYTALREYLNKGYEDRHINIVETGTARGFSSLCMSKAMSDHGAKGQIFTFDLLPHNTKMLWNCIDDLKGPRSRSELLDNWGNDLDRIAFIEGDSRVFLKKIALPRIDFAFLDGAHTYHDVMLEFDLVRQRQLAGDIIVFDDYSDNVFAGLVKAVDEGCEKWGYSKEVLRTNDQRAYVIATKQS